jgi:hypothetical protein
MTSRPVPLGPVCEPVSQASFLATGTASCRFADNAGLKILVMRHPGVDAAWVAVKP